MELQLSPEQEAARDQILAFFKKKGALLTLGGYAGTGKTTVIAETIKAFRQTKAKKRKRKAEVSIAFCAFTGRAASILKGKLDKAQALKVLDYCGTIHRLIYEPIIHQGKIVGWEKNTSIGADLIVVDEASMVSEEIFKDLSSYKVPILAVGDHGQLPPVQGQFNLMQDPEIKLEKIHRQAEGNPIVKLSMMARNREPIPVGEYGEWVRKVTDQNILDRIQDVKDVLLLCGRNSTRVDLNAYMRRRLGINQQEPIVGDKVICLKNNHDQEIYNGMTGWIEKIEPEGNHWYHAGIRIDNGNGGQPFSGRILKHQFGKQYLLQAWPNLLQREFGQMFDFGYAMTVHKAQGSESKRVVLFEEKFGQMTEENWARWKYTGITRSSERLIIVGKEE